MYKDVICSIRFIYLQSLQETQLTNCAQHFGDMQCRGWLPKTRSSPYVLQTQTRGNVNWIVSHKLLMRRRTRCSKIPEPKRHFSSDANFFCDFAAWQKQKSRSNLRLSFIFIFCTVLLIGARRINYALWCCADVLLRRKASSTLR